jgi:molybdopterin/thiamine biosynthesis adenylyltransferase/rhodanese-related sulfurtransferase/molybdopterin converting factor small subunit
MANKILIPTPLRPFTGKLDAVDVEGGTIGELLTNLTTKYEGLKPHLYNEQGKLRSFVNVYLNDEDIRYLQKENTPVNPGDTISIIPSVAGGSQGVMDQAKLSNEEVQRYSRHLIMPEVGVEGQLKLKAGSVLCIGAVDVVDFSNLQRQVIHGTPDVGRSKLASAKDRLHALNPLITIDTYETALSSKNALDLFKPYDVILDGTDNFPTRYLVNDACVILGKPNTYGSIFRFEGQASVFATKDGPCYRCLYPEPPPPGLVPSCAEGGVLGVLPGVIGTIQATEAVKLIMGIGEPLIGRFLIYDALRMKFRELKLKKDPDCPVCGTHPTVTALIDYEQFCGIAPAAEVEMAAPESSDTEIDVRELKRKMDAKENFFLLDVREPNEYQIGRIPGSTLIPLGEVPQRYQEIPKDREVVVHCKMGGRSAKAAAFLRQQGFSNVKNLKGGILDWSDKVDPSVPKY